MNNGTVMAGKTKSKQKLFFVYYRDKKTSEWGAHPYLTVSMESVVKSFTLCFKNKEIIDILEEDLR